jgi:cytochrome c
MADKSNKDPMLGNKIAGAILAALILVFGLPQLTGFLFGGGEGHGGGEAAELHLAYCCVELETETAAATEQAPPDLGTLLANATVAGGERRAALCKACHTLDEGGANSAGPNLWNVVNRPVASVDGFNYTAALKAAGGAWTYDRLDQYLKNSQDYIPGTAMAQRFAKPAQRADILAYLGSLSANPVAFPAPAAVDVPAGEETASDH